MIDASERKDPAGEFAGLVAVVTGGGSGIGHAAASTLLARGARVAVLDLDVRDAPPGALALPTDVADSASVDAAIAAVVGRFGGLDVVVNNAGIPASGPIDGPADAEWLRVLDVNVVGIARVSRSALPHLRASSHAAIVSTCSVAATVGMPGLALYSASKGAVLALTRAMATDHLNDGIRVNCVSPATVDSPWLAPRVASADDPEELRAALRDRQPNGRLVTSQEVADAISYLASPRSASTTGTELIVDGGLTRLRPPRA